MQPTLVVIGTRPEAIKLAPVVRELVERGVPVKVQLTLQHDADQVLPVLNNMGIKHEIVHSGDYENSMGVTDSIGRLIDSVAKDVSKWNPGVVIVQGDTASTFAGALAGFLQGVPVAHVEAGLRTHDLAHPFPEEGFRQAVARWTSLHLCPTDTAFEHLQLENVLHKTFRVTGNTGVDSLRIVAQSIGEIPTLNRVIFTLHRRESWGDNMRAILRNVSRSMNFYPDTEFLIIRHPNPIVGEEIEIHLAGAANATVIPPLDYPEMVKALLQARGIMTDSGGLQEEALALGIPTLVMRQKTERPELLRHGRGFLIGNEGEGIAEGLERMMVTKRPPSNLFRETVLGDGFASRRVVDALQDCQLC